MGDLKLENLLDVCGENRVYYRTFHNKKEKK